MTLQTRTSARWTSTRCFATGATGRHRPLCRHGRCRAAHLLHLRLSRPGFAAGGGSRGGDNRVLGERGQRGAAVWRLCGLFGSDRRLIAKLARDQGIQARRENILITAGGSQAIDLLLDALVDWGDTIISEDADLARRSSGVPNVGANIVSIPVDDEGIDVTALDASCDRLATTECVPKLIYANANFQNPTGATCPCERRQDLLALARRARTRSSSKTTPTLTCATTARTFRHLFARCQRLSRLHGHAVEDDGPRHAARLAGRPPELIRRVAALKVDGGTNVFGAHVAADWLPEKLLPHVERLREVYQRRRDLDARRTRAAHAARIDVDHPGWRVLHLADAPRRSTPAHAPKSRNGASSTYRVPPVSPKRWREPTPPLILVRRRRPD